MSKGGVLLFGHRPVSTFRNSSFGPNVSPQGTSTFLQGLGPDTVKSNNSVFYDLVLPEEVETAWKIENQGFPPDEADSFDTLRFHQRVAPDLFLGAFVPLAIGPRRLIAYTFATLSPIPRYTQESLTAHVPNATIVCSHTLCVDKEFRGASIGFMLFAEFIDMCRRAGKYDRMLFMAKENLVPVYERMGIKTVGRSEVNLGKDVWYEMCISFQAQK